ncbi:GntR family transcriptional regulator [Methylocella tundrae]|uniref:HTH gntR-type domain-containing protein n=1 Tax=Methylocella tundrae TaxID=227605 RepID=A0A4U8Z808_METTU|nr:GntR family transcriptional regulator [Methylocella tundrae]WPP02939.1 GntR family transcriptional regulator [Methylocella tundrae]VFU16612.1 conserved protein of unknown function [Methylocella tundrae]
MADPNIKGEQVSHADGQPASAHVVNVIKAGIRDGRFAPGQRLIEKELIEECGVGRGSIREALRLLLADGTITIELHRGAAIRRFTREEVWARHQIREVLEGLAASLAAANIATTPYRAEFLDMDKALTAAVERDDRPHYLQLNYRFHEIVVLMSGNPELQSHIDRTQTNPLRLHAARFMTAKGMRRSTNEHRLIIDAILVGDPEAAEAAMKAHIRGTRRTFVEMPDHIFARSQKPERR